MREMIDKIRIEASNKEEALSIAKARFSDIMNRDINVEELTLSLIKNKKGFLGIGSKKVYEAFFKKKKDEIFLENLEEINIDGDYKIRVSDDGIYVKIISPEGSGEPVYFLELKKELLKKEFIEVDYELIQWAIREANEEWIKIAPRKAELDRDGEIKLEIFDNKMKANISYYPELGGKKLSYKDIKEILKLNGVVFGIKEEKINLILKENEVRENVLIAEGKEAIPGKDAQFIYHFDANKESIGTKRADGSIDFYDLGLINSVKPGDLLVSKKDPEPGKPGITVTGEEVLPSSPKDKSLPVGKNVEAKDDYSLISSIAGQVIMEGNKVHVLPIYEISSNVDLSTGNIDFNGNVLIKGDVMEGFKIKAAGNVEVKGHVFAADIDSGGEVLIAKGFIGKNKSHVNAIGDVKIKFVENAFIKSEKNIIISDAIMHSQLTAGEKIEVKGNKGLLVGGVCRAGKEIEANIIGSALATQTLLEVGLDPDIKRRFNELEVSVKQNQINLNKSNKAINILEKIKNKGNLPQKKEIMYYKFLKTSKKLEKLIQEQREEYDILEEKLNIGGHGRIKANDRVYSGVKLIVGKSQYAVQDVLHHLSFIEEDGEVRQISL
jgi:uncharacterized protein